MWTTVITVVKALFGDLKHRLKTLKQRKGIEIRSPKLNVFTE